MAVCDARIIFLQIYFHHIVCANYIHIACSKNSKLCHSTCLIFERMLRHQCKLLQSCEEFKLFQSSHINAVISAVGQVLVNQT